MASPSLGVIFSGLAEADIHLWVIFSSVYDREFLNTGCLCIIILRGSLGILIEDILPSEHKACIFLMLWHQRQIWRVWFSVSCGCPLCKLLFPNAHWVASSFLQACCSWHQANSNLKTQVRKWGDMAPRPLNYSFPAVLSSLLLKFSCTDWVYSSWPSFSTFQFYSLAVPFYLSNNFTVTCLVHSLRVSNITVFRVPQSQAAPPPAPFAQHPVLVSLVWPSLTSCHCYNLQGGQFGIYFPRIISAYYRSNYLVYPRWSLFCNVFFKCLVMPWILCYWFVSVAGTDSLTILFGLFP